MDLVKELEKARQRQMQLSAECRDLRGAISSAEERKLPKLAATIRTKLLRWQKAVDLADALVTELESAVPQTDLAAKPRK